jgi:hypothetical protein
VSETDVDTDAKTDADGDAVVELRARPMQAELILARLGRFLQGRLALAWMAASALLAIVWAVARAAHHALGSQLVLPLLLVLVALPVLVVFAGVQGAAARKAITDGVTYRLDESGIAIDGASRPWRDVDDVFRIGNVLVLVIGGAVHAIPRRAFETRARWTTCQALLKRMRRPRGG